MSTNLSTSGFNGARTWDLPLYLHFSGHDEYGIENRFELSIFVKELQPFLVVDKSAR